jgi:uncharacterized protein HemY
MLILAAVALLVLFAAAAGDYVESYYVRAVADRQPGRAGAMSCAMYLMSLIGFVAVVRLSLWLVVPELFGVGLGSWFAVYRQRGAHAREREAARAASVLVEPDAQFWQGAGSPTRYVA